MNIKILLCALISSLKLFCTETIMVQGGVNATLIAQPNQQITHAHLIISGGSKVELDSVDNLKAHLSGGSQLNLPHVAEDRRLINTIPINNQLIRNVDDGTYHFAPGTRRVKIFVTGGSKLYIPKGIRRIDLKVDGGSRVEIIRDINNLDVVTIQDGSAIKYSQSGSLFYRIKRFSSNINRSITQSLQQLLLRNQAAPENPVNQRPVFNARVFWHKPQLPAVMILNALPVLNAVYHLPAQPAAPALQALPPA